LQAQLAAIVAQLEGAQARLHRLAAALPAERWAARADASRWSVAECVAHLNLTGQAYLPLLREALAHGRTLGAFTGRRYRRDPLGWLISLSAGPLLGVGGWRLGRVRTPPAFVPGGELPREEVMAAFDRLQAEQVALTRAAEGVPLDRLRITSPFDARIRYNAYACLVLIARHQQRHLMQAERVWPQE
jgi:hypothetical protein